MIKSNTLLFLGLLSSFISLAQVPIQFLPKSSKGIIYHHKYYSCSYSENLEQSIWVAYSLSPQVQLGAINRSDDFRVDRDIRSGSATLLDYKGSGYDRGHLAPAADMSFNEQAMSQSFLMSNMSPQVPAFNRGIWKELESTIRKWGNTEEKIYIVTGPAIINKSKEIGDNGVDVPSHYYKVVLEADFSQMTGFLLPNKKCEGELSDYIVTVDSIETVTGIDFFAELSEAIEKGLEMKKGTLPDLSHASTKLQSKSKNNVVNQNYISINNASLSEIMTLPYIGETKAKAIISMRPFYNKEDLLKVKGIGTATLTKINPYITM